MEHGRSPLNARHQRPSVTWNVPLILDWLGPPQRITRLCHRRGVSAPKAGTIRQWKYRKSIPGDWIATALSLMDDDIDLRQFIKRQRPNPFA